MVERLVLKIDKPHFVVKLHEDILEMDLKEGVKKELEDAVEAHPILRESVGILFQTIIPLDIALHDIESVEVSDEGQLKIVTPLRRDIIVPLETSESQRVTEKLNQLIPLAKLKEAERMKVLTEAEKRPKPKPREPV